MKLRKVTISKKSILDAHPSLPKVYKNIINILYTEILQNQDQVKVFEVDKLIKKNGRNDLSPLNEVKDKVGVYIFINKNCEPVYVGLAGESSNSKHSLKGRLQKQLNADLSNSTLAKNIRDIEGLLQNNQEILKIRDRKRLKELICKYTAYIIAIITGELQDDNAIEDAKSLEKVLIALLRPKYNK